MSHRMHVWMLILSLSILGVLFAGGNVAATGISQPHVAGRALVQSPPEWSASRSQTPTTPGMSDLMSQTFEFSGAFPS